jgi:hypothetical protein
MDWSNIVLFLKTWKSKSRRLDHQLSLSFTWYNKTAVLPSAHKTSAAGRAARDKRVQCGPVSTEFSDLSSPASFF